MIADAIASLRQMRAWLYMTWLKFLVRYRATLLGPLWLLVGPAVFIVLLGGLFSHINNADPAIFIRHLTVGLITWTLISGFVTGSTTVFQRNRPQIIQGGLRLTDIVIVDMLSTVLLFLHQAFVIVVVFVIFGAAVSAYALVSLVGLFLLLLNGAWLTICFGICGARYRDLSEVVQAVLRVAFLATPIIWMPGDGGQGGVIGKFLTYNPFFHFLELVRAPLLGEAIDPLSWGVVMTTTALGFVVAHMVYKKFADQVPLWV